MSVSNLAVAVQKYDAANAARTEQGQIIIAGFKGLDYAAFTTQQVSIVAQLVSAKLSDNTESAKRMLQRVIENLGIEKPKAPGESSDKQVKRESAKLETAKLVADCGITVDSTAEEILAKAGKATGAQQIALQEAAILKSKETVKADSVAFTAEKNALAKAMKACTDKALIAKGNKLFGVK